MPSISSSDHLESAFYREVMQILHSAQVPYLVGGAFALYQYTSIKRMTKDLDLFVLPGDFSRVLDVCAAAGFGTQVRFTHWLGKVFREHHVIDIIFGSANGLCTVDIDWFTHATHGEVFEVPVQFCPPEEMIWSKAFVMERDRFDGADVVHLMNTTCTTINWLRLLGRFHSHWRVLFSHLILFGFVYPSERSKIPVWLMTELVHRLQTEMTSVSPQARVCQGTLLSWSQYLSRMEQEGYEDARHLPRGNLNKKEIEAMNTTFRENEEKE
jgi:hypothetical protein